MSTTVLRHKQTGLFLKIKSGGYVSASLRTSVHEANKFGNTTMDEIKTWLPEYLEGERVQYWDDDGEERFRKFVLKQYELVRVTTKTKIEVIPQ